MFLQGNAFSYGEASPLLAGWSLYTGQCLLVAPTCCSLLEKIDKKHWMSYFLPMPRQWWLVGECLNWLWRLGASLQDGCFGFHPDFGWSFRSQVHIRAGGPGTLFPLSSRNCSSLLRIIEWWDCQLRGFLVERAERMNLTWLAGTYWSCRIFLMKYPVVSFQFGSKKIHFHKVKLSNLNYLEKVTVKFSSPALSKQGSSTRLLLGLLAPPYRWDYFSVQAVVREARLRPFTTPS